MLGPRPAARICEQPGWACLQAAWAEALPEILPGLLALLPVFTGAVCVCILRTRPRVKKARSMVETPEAASLPAPVPRNPSSPLPRQARARSDKRAAAGFSSPNASFPTGMRSGAVNPFKASSRRATDTPQTGADVEARRVSSDSSSSSYSSAMESSESTELLLAHKDSEMAEVQNKLDRQKSEYDECVAKCKEKEEILPKVSKLKAHSSSRSSSLPKRSSFSRSYSASSGLAAATGSPMRKFDGLSSGARFYNNVVQQMYSGDQRKRNAKTSESDPATAGAPSPRATECAPVSPAALAPRESKTSQLKPATAEMASASSVTSSTEVGPLSTSKSGSSVGPSREGAVRPFQPPPLQANSLFSAITRELMSTIETEGTFRVYRARHVVDTI
jgi:hypothetical protein